jgi:hypothetical protein
MAIGAVVLALGIVMIVGVVLAKAEPRAYVSGLLVSELGSMFLVMGMFPPGLPRTAVAAFFAIALVWTGIMLIKLRPKRTATPPAP